MLSSPTEFEKTAQIRTTIKWNRREGRKFRQWANGYLKRFFKEVVRPKKNNINLLIWHEMQTAARAINDTVKVISLKNPKVFNHIPDRLIDISKNRELSGFEEILLHIYAHGCAKKSFFGTVRNILPSASVVLNTSSRKPNADLSDLDTSLPEIINVNCCPIEMGSMVDGPNFEERLLRILTYRLMRFGVKSISTDFLANFLGITKRVLENWLLKNKKFVVRQGSCKDNLLYVSLAKPDYHKCRRRVKGEEMAEITDSVAVNQGLKKEDDISFNVEQIAEGLAMAGVDADNQAPPPAIGTSEFEQMVTQFLAGTKLWRTVDAISNATGHEPAAIQIWADSKPEIVRRPSTKDNGIYYALLARLAEKEEHKEEEKPHKDKKGGKSSQKPEEERVSVPLVTSQKELLAFAMLHRCCDDLIRINNFYANYLATHHAEAFSHLTKSQTELSSAVALFQKDLKIKDDKLPVLERI